MSEYSEQLVLRFPYPQSLCFEGLCDGQVRTPAEAYAYYVGQRTSLSLPRPDFYFSTTITSGGYHRDESLTYTEAFDANCNLAKELTDSWIAKFDLDPARVILPTELAKVAAWNQADYLLFWFHVIHGAQPEHAQDIEPLLQTDRLHNLATVMENTSLPHDLRQRAYAEFSEAFKQVLESTEEGLKYLYDNPRPLRVIKLIDSEVSLGCFGEQSWSQDFRFAKFPKGFDVNPNVGRAIRHLAIKGANVIGVTYDHNAAQAWADYYGDILVE